LTFGIECTNKLLSHEEIIVEHKTDIQRLKEEAKASGTGLTDSAVLVITNATLLTFATNSPDDLIHEAVLFVRDGVIEAIFDEGEDVVISQSSVVVDAAGGKCRT
jgi:sorbitol-specific phosphotransferase system component IIA